MAMTDSREPCGYLIIGESADGYPMARAWLTPKNERRIGKRSASGKRNVKIVLDNGGQKVLALVRRRGRWQHEEIARELLVRG